MRIFIIHVVVVLGLLGLMLTGCQQETPQDAPSLQGLELPAGLTEDEAALVVKGKIRKANPACFDLATIMEFPSETIEMKDPWKKNSSTYTGASLYDLLRFVDPEDSAAVLDVIASNDYHASIRIEDIKQYEYVLSYTRDGRLYQDYEEALNRGPLAIVINFGKHPELDYEVYKHQLVWYVKTIIVR